MQPRASTARQAAGLDPVVGGAALLDAMIAVTMLIVGILSASMSGLRSSELQQTTAAYIQAHDTVRDVLEQVRSGDLIAQYQAFAAAPDFTVGAQQVSVRFPESLLWETFGGVPPTTVRFRDLNADGEVDLDTASTERASLLPVQVTVRRGNLQVRLETLLTER